jgi:hypothetical protein
MYRTATKKSNKRLGGFYCDLYCDCDCDCDCDCYCYCCLFTWGFYLFLFCFVLFFYFEGLVFFDLFFDLFLFVCVKKSKEM